MVELFVMLWASDDLQTKKGNIRNPPAYRPAIQVYELYFSSRQVRPLNTYARGDVTGPLQAAGKSEEAG